MSEMTKDGSRLISIEVDGSTHTRTANEWLALARADLRAQAAPAPQGEQLVEWLKELDALEAKATPGPWAWDQRGEKVNEWALGTAFNANDKPLSGRFTDADVIYDEYVCSHEAATCNYADPEFICALRNAYPQLRAAPAAGEVAVPSSEFMTKHPNVMLSSLHDACEQEIIRHEKQAEFIYSALVELGRRIEACGASPELTHAVTLCSDLRQAIGNKWNKPDVYAADRVRKSLSAPPPPLSHEEK